jgi:hypothetical protein
MTKILAYVFGLLCAVFAGGMLGVALFTEINFPNWYFLVVVGLIGLGWLLTRNGTTE